VERLEKTLARVAREQGLDQERLRRWVSFLALCGVLEQAAERGVIDTYYQRNILLDDGGNSCFGRWRWSCCLDIASAAGRGREQQYHHGRKAKSSVSKV